MAELFDGGMGPISVKELLLVHMDVKSTPTPSTLKFLVENGSMNPEEAKALTRLANDHNTYTAWKDETPTLADVFNQFPSLTIDSAQLINNLAPLQPRYSSVPN